MQLINIAPEFVRLVNVFDSSFLDELNLLFNDYPNWSQLLGPNLGTRSGIRYEYQIPVYDKLAKKIKSKLSDSIAFIEQRLGEIVYQNGPQLWFDTKDYISAPHKDYSQNLTANLQIYLSDSLDSDIGTGCEINGRWVSVPYERNTGYILLNPTKILHGMRKPVKVERRSLYQSFRTTVEPVESW